MDEVSVEISFFLMHRKMADDLRTMVIELERDHAKYDFLGSVPWISNGGERSTAQEVVTVFYFDSYDGIHKFAHSPVHRKAWDWWNENMAKNDHLAVMHGK
jgi:hypothetical protein